jgi:hypothetical protein
MQSEPATNLESLGKTLPAICILKLLRNKVIKNFLSCLGTLI